MLRLAIVTIALLSVLPGTAVPADTVDSADVLYKQGRALIERGQVDSAFVALYHAADLYSSAADAMGEARALLAIGDIKRCDDDQSEALRLLLKARSLTAAGGDDETHIRILDALRYIYYCRNDMESYGRTTLELDSLYAVTSDLKAKAAYSLRRGTEARNSGDYAMSEHYYNQYLSLSLQLGGDTLQDLFTYNLNMAVMKREALQFDEALAYGLQYKAITHQLFTPDNSRWYAPYRELSISCQEARDSAGAFAYADSLCAMLELPGIDPMERAAAYVVRGLCHLNFRNFEQAISDFDAADSQTSEGQTYSSFHNAVLGLKAGALSQMDRYAEALPLYEEFASMMKSLYGENSSAYGRSLVYVANTCAYLGMVEQGCEDYIEAARLLMTNFREQLNYVSSAERESYWEDISRHLFNMTGFAVRSGHTADRFARACYDVLLFSKALLLESERSMYTMLRTHGTQQDVDDFAQLSALRTKAKSLERDVDNNDSTLSVVYDRMRDLDHRLMQHSKAYNDFTRFLNVDFDDIRASLGAGDVLIDFCDYKVQGYGERKHVAYIIRRDMDYPLIVNMFAQQQLDSLEAASKDGSLYDGTTAAEAVRLLWQPLAPYTSGGGTIYYVPSGLMYRIALEALPLADGQLLGNSCHMVRLSSARQITTRRATVDGDATAVLYGGLTFDVSPETMLVESSRYNLSPLMALRGSAVTGTEPFSTLVNTKTEIDTIGDILDRSGYDVLSLSGVHGTQESFVSMDGRSPSVLHIATHGFYYTPDEAEDIDYLKGYKDAMLLSGLVLSGANVAWLGNDLPAGVMSGILTAADISQLDLSATDMVVLSACRTAHGAVTSEGLFGLQRAFKKAGAGTVVMTLWDVSDVVTSEFMTAFYANLPQCQWSKREAFETARAAIRSRYPEPFYWAAFVMVD